MVTWTKILKEDKGKTKEIQRSLDCFPHRTEYSPQLPSSEMQEAWGGTKAFLGSSLGFYLNFSQVHTFIPRIELPLHPEIKKEKLSEDLQTQMTPSAFLVPWAS